MPVGKSPRWATAGVHSGKPQQSMLALEVSPTNWLQPKAHLGATKLMRVRVVCHPSRLACKENTAITH
eukprot:1158761-Pelagomonas_calceolata.AAC.2